MQNFINNIVDVFAPIILPMIKRAVRESLEEIQEDYKAGVNAIDENLSAEQLCKRWGICRATLANYQNKGVINPIHIGGRKVCYKMEDILAAESSGKIKSNIKGE